MKYVYGNSLFDMIASKIGSMQMQSMYDVTISSKMFKVPMTSEREVQKIYAPIVCGFTKCKYGVLPNQLDDGDERCK